MEKEQLAKDIVYVAKNWDSSGEEVEEKITNLLSVFPICQSCNVKYSTDNLFWVIEEVKSGLIFKKYHTDLFSVCSLRCLLDRGLNKNAYYSVVVRLSSGKVLSTGFNGRDAWAIKDFADEISNNS